MLPREFTMGIIVNTAVSPVAGAMPLMWMGSALDPGGGPEIGGNMLSSNSVGFRQDAAGMTNSRTKRMAGKGGNFPGRFFRNLHIIYYSFLACITLPYHYSTFPDHNQNFE
jgi:hypothetical protein